LRGEVVLLFENSLEDFALRVAESHDVRQHAVVSHLDLKHLLHHIEELLVLLLFIHLVDAEQLLGLDCRNRLLHDVDLAFLGLDLAASENSDVVHIGLEIES
jgi:hypothetical protein